MFKRFRSLFRVLTRRREFEDGMSEELRFHIEQYTDDLVRSGMSREKAARHARIEFGSLKELILGNTGDALDHFRRITRVMFLQQLKHTSRVLQR